MSIQEALSSLDKMGQALDIKGPPANYVNLGSYKARMEKEASGKGHD